MNALLATALATSCLPALAANSSGDEVIDALMQRFGLSEADVRRHLTAQSAAMRVEEALKRSLGEQYAGAWYDPSSFGLAVATTNQLWHAQIRQAGARPVSARRSLAKLQDISDRIYVEAVAADWHSGITVTYTDYATNAVVLGVLPEYEAQVRADVLALGFESGAVQIKRAYARLQPFALIYDGNKFVNNTHPNTCSIGFAVQQGGYVTAAHCGGAGDQVGTTPSQPLGRFAGSTLPPAPEPLEPGQTQPRQDNPDQAWVSTSAGWDVSTQLVSSSGRHIIGAQSPMVGAWACRYGQTTGGPHCGSIQSVDARFMNFGVFNGVPVDVYPMIKVSSCGDRGDSGGPLVIPDARKIFPGYAYAVGTLTAGELPAGCPGAGVTYFSSVSTALQRFGLNLKVLKVP